MGAYTNRRIRLTRWFVPHVAFRWALSVVSIATAITSAGLATLIVWYQEQFVAELNGMGLLRGTPIAAELSAHGDLLLRVLVVGVVGVVLATVLVTAFALHRVTGPLVRVATYVRLAAAGERLPPLKVRIGDHYGELADDLNKLLAKVGQLQEPPK